MNAENVQTGSADGNARLPVVQKTGLVVAMIICFAAGLDLRSIVDGGRGRTGMLNLVSSASVPVYAGTFHKYEFEFNG